MASETFSGLPTKCLINVLSFLPAPDLARASEVCKQWRELASLPSLWRSLCLRSLFPFLSTDPAIYSSVGSSDPLPATLLAPVSITAPADTALQSSGGSAVGTSDDGGDQVGRVCILRQPDDGRHHVVLFQEQLFALPIHVRRRVLPFEELAQCTSPHELRQCYISADPFLVELIDHAELFPEEEWKQIYINRKQAMDNLYKFLFLHMRTEATAMGIQFIPAQWTNIVSLRLRHFGSLRQVDAESLLFGPSLLLGC